MRLRFGEAMVYCFNQFLFRGPPEIRVMAEGTIKLLSHFDHLMVAEGGAFLETFQGLGDAGRIIEYAKRIDLSAETQATADATHLVGKAGAQEEQSVTIDDGWGKRGDINFGSQQQFSYRYGTPMGCGELGRIDGLGGGA